MTEQEQRDLNEVNAYVQVKKLNFYEMCKTIQRATPAQLSQMGVGGKTVGEAMQLFYVLCERNIKKALDAHVRKYPDSDDE